MIQIEYAAGKYKATVPLTMVRRIQQLPGARYDVRSGKWTIADIAYNRREMRRWPETETTYSPDAADALRVDAVAYAVTVPFPPGYPWKTPPFKHQRDACELAYGKHEFALFMEMGTGKTKVVIDLAAAYAMAGEIDQVLVLSPLTVRGTWEREITAHIPRLFFSEAVRLEIHYLSSNRKAFDRWEAETRARVLTPEGGMAPKLRWALAGIESMSMGGAANVAAGFVTPQTLVVVDESTRIKSHRANRTQAAIALGKNAGYRMILTGAPITKGIEDLFGQFLFLSPEILGTDNYYAFRNTYCVLGGWQGKQIIGYQNTERLLADIKPFVYQVRKSEALDLPPKVYQVREVPMKAEQKRAYVEAVKEARISLHGKELTITNVLTKLLRLHQIAQGFVGTMETDSLTGAEYAKPEYLEAPKIDELLNVLDELDGPVIIWAVYHAEIDRIVAALHTHFPAEVVVELHGRVSEKGREVAMSEFQAGSARFLVGNPATGGLGVTLTRAETVIYMSNGFSLEHRTQSEDRAHRIGTNHTVTYIDMLTPASIDTMVMRALRAKRGMSDYVRDALDADTLWTTLGEE